MLNRQDDKIAQPDTDQAAVREPKTWKSIWVVMGFMLWLGFFIGAVIMHAMVK